MEQGNAASGHNSTPWRERINWPGVDYRAINAYACAHCRRLWPALPLLARQGLEVAERWRDGEALDAEAADMDKRLWQALGSLEQQNPFLSAEAAALRAVLCCFHQPHFSRDPDDGTFVLDWTYDAVEGADTFCWAVETQTNIGIAPPNSLEIVEQLVADSLAPR